MKPDYGLKNLLPVWQVALFAILSPFVLVIALFDMWVKTLWMKIIATRYRGEG